LEREARKRNCRLWAILICVIISLLVYIIVPLAVKGKLKKNKEVVVNSNENPNTNNYTTVVPPKGGK